MQIQDSLKFPLSHPHQRGHLNFDRMHNVANGSELNKKGTKGL